MRLQELKGSVIECSCCKLGTLLPPKGIDGSKKKQDLLRPVLHSEEEEQKLLLLYSRSLLTKACNLLLSKL